jgi:hypothetical protein
MAQPAEPAVSGNFAPCAAKSRSDHADHENSDVGDRGKPIANIVLHRNKK